MLVYVDDIVVTGSSSTEIDDVVRQLSLAFSLKDLGELGYFLGIEIERCEGSLVLSQRKFVLELLTKTGMDKAKSVVTPMVLGKLQSDVGDLLCDAREYRSIIGGLLYVCHTRPEITYSVNQVAQYMHAPRTLEYGLVISPYGVNVKIVAFADADWGGNLDDRKSISGHCVFVGDNLVSWTSKKQKIVSRSTMEAEYRNVADAAAEVAWVDALLSDMGVVRQGAGDVVAMSSNPIYHAKPKHVELDMHFVREKVVAKQVVVNYVPASHQVTDGVTKPLSRSLFEQFRSKPLQLDCEEAAEAKRWGKEAVFSWLPTKDLESCDHLFTGCFFAKEVWRTILASCGIRHDV
ncbi:uncharacterized mitochondrial protein AtMg00810-like [Hibiscus syriacus]|uniref:uncharacterized mitochondrial protein AtMg00810-like n=1 Tax=Hibiscus syriacus TaxID=106335 RepID=UPI0019208474|nr:uncharacterized mitochondrial protein AtMg00810-like [Hibiscus syriacus]